MLIKEDKIIKKSITALLLILITTLLMSLISIIYSFNTDDTLTFSFCITEKCISVISENFKNTLTFANSVITVSLSAFTVLGIFIAAMSYKLSVSSSLINNHINNFNLFSNFITNHIDSSNYLSVKNIDIYLLYDSIYPKSREGQFGCYESYFNFINQIRNYLLKASNSYKSGKRINPTEFKYGEHQDKLIAFFKEIGINLEKQHKNDFYLVEAELFSFLDNITLAFTNANKTQKKFFLSSITTHYR
ncbi:retron Ec48 family effector membrane protein [Pseudoalteromonas haloplanktis]|uniref:Retron Ec48 family effector membrane protein n=1 Tax=Pseudoalteromonas haloplanktis TaxID=228 RepID=A0ABU1BA74_PSEHA|nr:retron Ec48 family effector membrane protein [Pseudoalteromonas haloplanktis]MDQ9091256.1 retron Ec48 family effector membrane protein [Pseudoalteromonas haloplanktis]